MTFESLIDPRLMEDAPAETEPTKGEWKALEWEAEQVRRTLKRMSAEPQPIAHEAPPQVLKRCIDVLLGGLLFALAAPIIAFLALGVVLSLRDWPFFVHDRVGKDTKTFRMLKLRTLPSVVPHYADKRELVAYSIPWFCRLLRHTHLDELPQLLLVVMGKMSLVGPRPHWDEPIDPAYLSARTSVRPGCTGLWQMGHHRHGSCVETPIYDYFYLENASLLLDAWILWRTLLAVTTVGRPLAVTDVPRWALRNGTPEVHRGAEPLPQVVSS